MPRRGRSGNIRPCPAGTPVSDALNTSTDSRCPGAPHAAGLSLVCGLESPDGAADFLGNDYVSAGRRTVLGLRAYQGVARSRGPDDLGARADRLASVHV